MFELFPNSIEYPCINHPSQNCTHLCIDSNCSSHPFLCQHCLNDFRLSSHSNHQQNILPIVEAVNSLSQELDDKKYEIDKISQKVFNKVDLDTLLKKFQDKDQTVRIMDNHLKGIKAQIEKETDQLLAEFQKRLMLNKQNLFNQIQSYQKNYFQSIQNYRQILEPLAFFKKSMKYYCNPNNIYLKMHNELKRKSAEWYISMKKSISQIYATSEKVQSLGDNISKVVQSLGSSQDMPYLKNVQIGQSTRIRMQYFINETLNQKLVMKGMKQSTDAALQEEYRGSNNHRIQKRFY